MFAVFALFNFTYCNIAIKNRPTISVPILPGGYTKNIDLKIYKIISKRKKTTEYILSKYIAICKYKKAFELKKSIFIIKNNAIRLTSIYIFCLHFLL